VEEMTAEIADNEVAAAVAESKQVGVEQSAMERPGQSPEPVAQGQSVPLSELEENKTPLNSTGSAEIDLNALIHVSVTLSVEIGRSRIPIKQLIGLNQGSVVELDRAVNEPLDLLVNGTLIARGEVVVVDGKFGLRLIDVVSRSERLEKLK